MSKNKDISKFLSASIRSGILDSAITNNDVPSGIDVFDTLDSLPLSGLVKGQEAFVEENSRIYVSNGSGWYNVGTNIQISPTWLIEPDATYTVADSATPLIITAKAQDSDTPNVVNQSFVSDSAQYMVTISNDSSVWTFTPKSTTQIATSVDAGELTDSNGDFIYTFKWSDGINVLSKAVTIAYNPAFTSFEPSGISVFPSAHLDLDQTHEIIRFNGDGTVLMTWRPYGFTQYFQWWDLTTAYDISTATLNNSKSFDNSWVRSQCHRMNSSTLES